MDVQQLEGLEALERNILAAGVYNGLSLTRYLQVSALTCTLYDHLLTLRYEIEFVYHGKFSYVKGLYILIRYGIEASLIYVGFIISGFRPKLDVELLSYVPVLWTCTMVFSICTNLYVAFHHYTVWDRRKATFYVLLLCLVGTYVPAGYFGIQAVFDYREAIVYASIIDQCAPILQPNSIKEYWACLFAFDVLAMAVIVMNSFHRPFAQRQDVFTSLRRDGAVWFVILMCLRLANLIISVFARPEYIVLVVFNIWSLITITISRLILRTEGFMKNKPGTVQVWNAHVGGFELSRFVSYP
ncbi:hypothetical protein PsYK624_098240 [Phanerochaete sordida]|uniref:DUF6533 domain-containing protein n=1 Tax=Phanerochaete sordida TaxID=48140 RepID=A0A9P3GHE9_9APHY|nr:hypothetical protein PsYK624_098240 [Phanerochaete sordida]